MNSLCLSYMVRVFGAYCSSLAVVGGMPDPFWLSPQHGSGKVGLVCEIIFLALKSRKSVRFSASCEA